MAAVEHSFGVRCCFRCSLQGVYPAIPADDLHTWMLIQPGTQNLVVAAQQQIYRMASLEIDDERPCLTCLKRPIINAHDPRGRNDWNSLSTQEGEQSGGTDRHRMRSTLPGPGLPP